MSTSSTLHYRRLEHLHQASQTTFTTSPALSAYLASTVRNYAEDNAINLADLTWRKNCACCGYALIPGWTTDVAVKGWAKEQRQNQTSLDAEKGDDPGKLGKHMKKRKRKRKRTGRDAKDKTETDPLEQDNKEQNVISVLSQNPKSTKPTLAQAPTSTKCRKPPKKPRTVYTCRICDRKTTHQIYPTQSSKTRSLVSSPSPNVLSAQNSPLPSPAIIDGTSSPLQYFSNPESGTSTPSSASRKRSKARKNTLSELLAKEKLRSSLPGAGGASGGFGLDLMDLMKTT